MPRRIKDPIKLNLGCGANKIPGFINIDCEPACKPDLVLNFLKDKLPYKDGSVDEIVLFHTIEHIIKTFHSRLLKEFWRVLKPGASLYISYPEFTKCYEGWKNNLKGQKTFFEATLYGRQIYPSDFHVCIMHTPDFRDTLEDCGFCNLLTEEEPGETFNTIVRAVKGVKPPNYEDLVKVGMNQFQFEKVGSRK